ncbi:hypothetical protein CHRYSEOSP005_14810 [Chryseobacterium sp. Alg-005]
MKTAIISITAYVIGLLIFFFMWSFYWLTIDFTKWNQEGRVTFLIFGNLFSIITPITIIVFRFLEPNTKIK